jgi:thiosulfate dehydrogenase [quinone] large subunit
MSPRNRAVARTVTGCRAQQGVDIMASVAPQRRDTRGALSDTDGSPVGTRMTPGAAKVFAVSRILIGLVFLWAFLDKMFGLGFATPSERSWLNGGSPTTGYLGNLEGTFASQFGSLAGKGWADWLFMIGLLGIGVALVAGIAMRLAAASGALLLMLMWAASLPLENNPVIDDHVVYAVVLVGLGLAYAGDTWGFGKVWARTGLVQRMPWLR